MRWTPFEASPTLVLIVDSIARRYGLGVAELLERNGLDARGVLRPGMVLAIDPAGAGATVVAE